MKDRYEVRQAGRQAGREAGRRAGGQAGWLAGWQAGRENWPVVSFCTDNGKTLADRTKLGQCFQL
jgi:hypothetical protein